MNLNLPPPFYQEGSLDYPSQSLAPVLPGPTLAWGLMWSSRRLQTTFSICSFMAAPGPWGCLGLHKGAQALRALIGLGTSPAGVQVQEQEEQSCPPGIKGGICPCNNFSWLGSGSGFLSRPSRAGAGRGEQVPWLMWKWGGEVQLSIGALFSLAPGVVAPHTLPCYCHCTPCFTHFLPSVSPSLLLPATHIAPFTYLFLCWASLVEARKISQISCGMSSKLSLELVCSSLAL